MCSIFPKLYGKSLYYKYVSDNVSDYFETRFLRKNYLLITPFDFTFLVEQPSKASLIKHKIFGTELDNRLFYFDPKITEFNFKLINHISEYQKLIIKWILKTPHITKHNFNFKKSRPDKKYKILNLPATHKEPAPGFDYSIIDNQYAVFYPEEKIDLKNLDPQTIQNIYNTPLEFKKIMFPMIWDTTPHTP